MITGQIGEDLMQFSYPLRNPQWRVTINSSKLLQVAKTCTHEPLLTQKQTPSTQFQSDLLGWELTPSTPMGRAINTARCRLVESGIRTANHDAYAILAHVMQKEQDWIFANYDYELDAQQVALYTQLIKRRAANEPLSELFSV